MRIISLLDCFFFSSRRRHTRFDCDWSSDVCSSDLGTPSTCGTCSEYLEHYNAERPHQARGNVPLPEADEEPRVLPFPSGKVKCREAGGEIGRASCRERVWGLVVAVCIKK